MLAYLRAPLLIWRISGLLLLGAGVDDRLGELHVVDVERADGEPAGVGEVEHRLGGHEWHVNSSFPVSMLVCEPAVARYGPCRP